MHDTAVERNCQGKTSFLRKILRFEIERSKSIVLIGPQKLFCVIIGCQTIKLIKTAIATTNFF